MNLVTGKEKLYSLLLSKSGNGKTVLMFLLMKLAHLPTIIIDNNEQFTGYHKSLKELVAYFLDYDNLRDFIDCKRQILVSLKPDEAREFYDYLMKTKSLAGSLIVNDEIDLTLGVSHVPNSHPFYIFCNKGRHLEYKFLATARATQDIPKCLTQQTDVFYIGMVQNRPMLDYLTTNTNIKDIERVAALLEPFQYLKYNTQSNALESLKMDFDSLKLFK